MDLNSDDAELELRITLWNRTSHEWWWRCPDCEYQVVSYREKSTDATSHDATLDARLVDIDNVPDEMRSKLDYGWQISKITNHMLRLLANECPDVLAAFITRQEEEDG